MTMTAAALLDELMGANRNKAPNENNRETRFDDEEVCKHFLCGFCPCDLFTNTRADLGPCTLIHDDELRRKYKISSRYENLGFEEDFMRQLQTLLSDVDKRIRKGQARLALNSQMASQGLGGPQEQREEKIALLTDRINELVEQAEVLGCEGKVEEAQGVMKLWEQLKEERTQLETIEQRPPTGTGKEMEVCNICGALLVVGDAQQRIDEHIMGKQHMGYAQIRSYIESYKNRKKDEETMREERLKKEREEREKEREQEREERIKQREEREKKEKEREKEREERRKKRSRSRDRDRDRDSRRRRSRSRERRRSRSRSRDRRRSRSRDRKRRSRDRHTSRDKDRRRSHSRSRKSRDRDHDRSKDRSKEKSRDRDRSKDRKSHDKEEKKDKEEKSENGSSPPKMTSPEKTMETETNAETKPEVPTEAAE